MGEGGRAAAGPAADEGRGKTLWTEAAGSSGEFKMGYFSHEEDAALRGRVREWGQRNGRDLTDLSWAVQIRFKKKSNEKMATGRSSRGQGLWNYVAEGLGGRTAKQCWGRGSRLLHSGSRQGKWDSDEDENLLKLAQKFGATDAQRWVRCGEVLGRTGDACATRWRVLQENHSAAGKNKGTRFSEEEDAQVLAGVKQWQERKAGGAEGSSTPWSHPLLRVEAIDWTEVAKDVPTRTPKQCMNRYNMWLKVPMREAGEWGAGEDKKMLRALVASGAESEAGVRWGNVVEGRSADVTMRRWVMMKKFVPGSRFLGFRQCLDRIVAQRAGKVKKQAEEARRSGATGAPPPRKPSESQRALPSTLSLQASPSPSTAPQDPASVEPRDAVLPPPPVSGDQGNEQAEEPKKEKKEKKRKRDKEKKDKKRKRDKEKKEKKRKRNKTPE